MVGQEDEGGTGDASTFLGQKDETEVAVLASSKVALNGSRVRRQELLVLLYCGIVRLSRVLEERGGREPLHSGIN